MIIDKIRKLLKMQKTPLYIFDTGLARERIMRLRNSLPEGVELCYAIKANTFILREIEDLVDYFEICSPGEYSICEKAMLPQSKYVISGVHKETSFIESLVTNRKEIGLYTVESMSQFVLLRNAAVQAEKKIRILLRLSSGNQFGLDREALFILIENYKYDKWVHIHGIQYFTGTQKNSQKKLRREIDFLDDLMAEIYERFAFHVEKLEYGPGFPVAYFENDHFDESAFLEAFSEMLAGMKYDGRITLELGRSIAAACGTYLTSVVDTKCNNDESYAIVDGGMHQIVYYGQSMAMKHPKISLVKKEDLSEGHIEKESDRLSLKTLMSESSADDPEEAKKNWHICGSLCTVNDMLVKRYPLPALEIGDVLVFHQTGAYCVTEGIALFLSREMPAVVCIDQKGNMKVVREQIQTELFNTPMN